ncbi:hypothetical protein EU537_10830 [Candidatus Thorarchaeota archaeon]|nr:MAG: hypothetical protein EU537_10830 [Candidatus Thorarchaeota archaeon]
MEEYLSDLVEPIHANSFFSVSKTGEIHERLEYEYADPEGYYRRVIKDDDLLTTEVTNLATNMQFFLDEERVEINGERVKSEVVYTDILLKGISEVVSVVYLIDFAGRFQQGPNSIQTWLEEEEAPYDFEIMWRFPAGTKILLVDTLLDYEIYSDIIMLWAMEGEHVGGYERMDFEFPDKILDTRKGLQHNS